MVICKIDGCGRECTHYPVLGICQKHYFRFMRNGTYDIVRSRKYRIQNPAGYQRLFEPQHPLADSGGYVYEHRKIVHDMYGGDLPCCQICDKDTNWETCHIDHIDCDVTNNKKENLRPVCRPCNTMRGRMPEINYEQTKHKITHNGVTETSAYWAKQHGISVSAATIRNRKIKGMSDYDCLFASKKTHKTIKA